MGFRMSKSIKVAPGVRMSFSKSGIGYSAGVKGYRVTKRADGRVQTTASIPGTGLSHTSTTRRSTAQRSSTPRAAATSYTPAPVKPGAFAPKGEKELFKAIQRADASAMERIGQDHPQVTFAAATLAGLLKFRDGDSSRARALLAWVFAQCREPASDPFLAKYCTATMRLEVAPGAVAELGLDRSSIGLALAELHQEAGDLQTAADVVEQVEPTTFAALSLAELYSQLERHEDVIGLTQNIANEDDASALLCVFRGVALRELSYFDAARDTFKEALKSKKRASVVRHRALLERARTYEAEGKRGMAKKDLERIMAEDSSYPGLGEALEALSS
jgi:tetratricopeptide (TPR) repeat protein